MRQLVVCLALLGLLGACTSVEPSASPGSKGSSTGASPEVTGSPSARPRPSRSPIVDPNNPVAPGFWPVSVAFWDERHGLIAGKIYGCESCSHAKGAVAVTIDGGATWRLTYTGSSQIASLDVLGDDMAWATLGYRHPMLIASTDGGETWRHWPGGAGLSNATFSAPGQGWAMARYGGGIVHWTGSGWVALQNPCSGEVVDLSFPEDGGGRGWLACSWGAGAGNELKGIYETRDGGSSWQPRTLVRPDRPRLSMGSGLGSYGYLAAISFLPDGKGWLIESRGTFYSTEDGGSSWQGHTRFQEPEIAFGTAVWRVDDQLGFALLDRRGMVLYRTQDGGQTWSRVASFHPRV